MKWIIRGFAIGLLIGLLLPINAMAGSWTDCALDTTEADVGNVGHRNSVCFEPITGDLTSKLLYVALCENFDVLYDDDQADTSGSATCQVMNCVAPSVSANHCNAIAGVTLTGQSPNEAIYGAAGQWVYAVCTDPTAETPRLLLHCNP